MPVTPSTNLKLIKCPIELDNRNQLTFATKQAQFTYFDSLPHTDLIEDSYYQRKDSFIEFPGHIDSIIEYNYCMYQNENYTDKWFYCFITKMEYISDGLTRIFIATDVYQTWQFDLTWKQSFIVREMLSTSDDVAGANLVPESLETGEYKIQSSVSVPELEPIYIVAYIGDQWGGSYDLDQNGYKYNGIFSSITYFVSNSIDAGLQILNAHGEGQYIFTVFTVPKLAFKDKIDEWEAEVPPGSDIYYFHPIEENYKQTPKYKTVTKPTTLDSYTPVNKKLLTFPYCYLGFNPQNGSSKVYRFENFSGNPNFKMLSEVAPNPTVQFIPQNYRGITGDNLSDNASLNGYPTISYKNDYFNSWLANNANTISLNIQREKDVYNVTSQNQEINATMNGVSNLLQGNLIGAFKEGVSYAEQSTLLDVNHEYNIKSIMAQIEQQKLLPDTGTLSSSNATLLGYDMQDDNIFTVYTIKQQFARKIDKYFSMFGYATNEVKLPNLNNRTNWNYVRTEGANIEGNIPQEDLQTIKNIFNNGVTLWHNPSTFLDYSQSNA